MPEELVAPVHSYSHARMHDDFRCYALITRNFRCHAHRFAHGKSEVPSMPIDPPLQTGHGLPSRMTRSMQGRQKCLPQHSVKWASLCASRQMGHSWSLSRGSSNVKSAITDGRGCDFADGAFPQAHALSACVSTCVWVFDSSSGAQHD